MISYKTGKWALRFVFQIRGSVFPKAVCWALPNAALAILAHIYLKESLLPSMEGIEKAWSGYTSVLGFLIVFRNNQAFSRFWEGATLVQQVRGEWFNACSSLIAFSSKEESKSREVDRFHHVLVRLASLLYCSALQSVCDLKDDAFEILDVSGIDETSFQYLQESTDRVEIILQWIQRLIVDESESGVLKIPPPILSRAYQELSRGVVNLTNVRKIKEIPFPFPYAQMITCMLLVHWVVTPLVCTHYINSLWIAAIIAFFVSSAFWSLHYIAVEIDQPFGDDPNDLPLKLWQRDYNKSLLRLLDREAQRPPGINMKVSTKKVMKKRMTTRLFVTEFSSESSLTGKGSTDPMQFFKAGVQSRLTRLVGVGSKKAGKSETDQPPGMNSCLSNEGSDVISDCKSLESLIDETNSHAVSTISDVALAHTEARENGLIADTEPNHVTEGDGSEAGFASNFSADHIVEEDWDTPVWDDTGLTGKKVSFAPSDLEQLASQGCNIYCGGEQLADASLPSADIPLAGSPFWQAARRHLSAEPTATTNSETNEKNLER